jgi:cellulose synthase/poly-beta-1,6-N-acetylglucosamine synthase-like glycosyltransferase
VDFLFPCGKEPPEIPLEAVRAGLAMDYPADRFRILVLDDGGQDELKKVAVEALQSESGYGKQLRYLRRTKLPGVPSQFQMRQLELRTGTQ